ncbi:MAG: hypothetical protein H8E73_03480 [Planctomycetes bacterium]|nr:hypothetical protein [Planctomycetota bacterium]
MRSGRNARKRVTFLPVCVSDRIIHRDLKPSNIMVTLHDGTPVPRVIDFGISKATNQRLTEKTLFTRYSQMIGTPEYMSPEQAEMSGLDVDTRTEVYSPQSGAGNQHYFGSRRASRRHCGLYGLSDKCVQVPC